MGYAGGLFLCQPVILVLWTYASDLNVQVIE